MNNFSNIRFYRVAFFKKPDEKDSNSKAPEYLGEVELDDVGVGQDLTIVAKAFRHAPEKCALADRVSVSRV